MSLQKKFAQALSIRGSFGVGWFNVPLILPVLLYVLSTPASAAITIVQAAGADYVPMVAVTGLPAGASGKVTLDPASVTHLGAPGMGSDFLATFAADVAQYPGWTAVTGAALNGTLTIEKYQAISPHTTIASPSGGARMRASYVVEPMDGFALTDLKWIQTFTDNTGMGGALVSHIDPFPNDDPAKAPWYYTAAEDGGTLSVFVDVPGDAISSIPFHRTVAFETYLATFDLANKVATIHDGFAWGYEIVVVPEPSTWILCMIGAVLIVLRVAQLRAPRRMAVLGS